LKWKAKDSRGRVGWIPAHYARALDPEQFPVPGYEKKIDHLEIVKTMQDPNIKCASTDLLSFLDDPDTYLIKDSDKPRPDFSKSIYKPVEPGKGKGFVLTDAKIPEIPVVALANVSSGGGGGSSSPRASTTSMGKVDRTASPREKVVKVPKKPEDINDLSVNHFPEVAVRERKAKPSVGSGPKKEITKKAESGIDVKYGKGVDLSHVDMSNKGSKLTYDK